MESSKIGPPSPRGAIEKIEKKKRARLLPVNVDSVFFFSVLALATYILQ